jgi:transcriptional regulator with XRE-family HTH domain
MGMSNMEGASSASHEVPTSPEPGSDPWADNGSIARDQSRVGARLRAYRRRSGKTLREVGTKSSLSESFLSQLERGKVNASISSLQRLTAVLGVTVADLFGDSAEDGPVRLLRRHERPAISFGKLGRKYMLTPGQQKHLEIFQVTFEVGGSTGDETYSHGASDEFIFVMSGTFDVEVDGVTTLLGPGDSLLFNSSSQHRVVNVGGRPAEVLWVISPPSY